MATNDNIEHVLAMLSEYTKVMISIDARDYATALAINSTVAAATNLSRDLLHLKLVLTIERVHDAAATLKAETATLKGQADGIRDRVGDLAETARAAGIAVQVALAVAAF